MISKLSDVQSKKIGKGTTIWQFCVILKNAVIGKNCNINCNVFIENDVIIGDDVTIKPCVQIWDGIRLGNKVFVGSNVSFTNDITPRSKIYQEKYLKTIVEEGASIGTNSIILPGIIIGKYAMIGAGSLINENIGAFTLWYGNPAKHRGYVTREGKTLNLQKIDKEGKKYLLINEEPQLI